MAADSESLLSDGRRLWPATADRVLVWPRGNAEGQRVAARRPPPDDKDDCDPFLELDGGLVGPALLWLLSVRVSSKLVFLFWMTSPPAMTTGAILSARKESWV